MLCNFSTFDYFGDVRLKYFACSMKVVDSEFKYVCIIHMKVIDSEFKYVCIVHMMDDCSLLTFLNYFSIALALAENNENEAFLCCCKYTLSDCFPPSTVPKN